MIKKQSGFALVWVIVILVITTMFGVGIYTVTSHNIKHMTFYNNNLEAYYLAESGIELAYSALHSNIPNSGKLLIDTLAESGNPTLEMHHEVKDGSELKGTFDVSIIVKKIDERYWIVVESLGSQIVRAFE